MQFDISVSQFFNEPKWVDALSEQRMLWVYIASAFFVLVYLIMRIRRVENGQKSYRGGWQERYSD